MRYYAITMTNSQTGANVLPSSLNGLPLSSLAPPAQASPGGPNSQSVANPAALNIEFDIPVQSYGFPLPQGGPGSASAYLRIWGLGLQDLQQSYELVPPANNGGAPTTTNIVILGGMSKGLPLANPSEQGVICQGAILQAYGNWIGTEQTLDLAIIARSGSAGHTGNFVFSWPTGTSLQSAISNTLSIALPTYTQAISISPNLVLNYNEYANFGSLQEMSSYLNAISKKIMQSSTYAGVTASLSGSAGGASMGAPGGPSVVVTDGTQSATTPLQILFQDMIGQPTWIGVRTISAKFVLRGDLSIGQLITVPTTNQIGLFTTTQSSWQRLQPAFTGQFKINSIHHFGNFRQASSESWCTVVEATIPATGNSATSAPSDASNPATHG